MVTTLSVWECSMVTSETGLVPTRVLLLEPNAALRSAIVTVLGAELYQVDVCESLEQVVVRTDHTTQTIALVAWQSMEGLLAEEHRHHLIQLTRRLRLVLMVPRRWARLLEETDLTHAVAGLVAKPFDSQELLDKLRTALAVPIESSADRIHLESPRIQAN
jgi:DNA-binding response OmpR family regulator